MLINIIANWNNIELLAVIFSICYVILAAKKKLHVGFLQLLVFLLYIHLLSRETLRRNNFTIFLFDYGFLRFENLE